MNRFKVLFFEIYTEHIFIEMVISLAYIALVVLVGLLSELDVFMLLLGSLVIVSCVEFLRLTKAVIKSLLILRKCKQGSVRFLDIYMEWTGKHY